VLLRGPADLIAAVPLLLGFHPTHSLVAVGLHADGRFIAVTMRVDLPPPAHREQGPEDGSFGRAVLAMMLGALQNVDATKVRLLVYPTGACPDVASNGLPHAAVIARLCQELHQHQVMVADALCVIPAVGGTSWWSYLCDDGGCCPAEGQRIKDSDGTHIRAAFALEGIAALPDRAALVTQLAAGLPGDPAVEMLEVAICTTAARELQLRGDGWWEKASVRRWRQSITLRVAQLLLDAAHHVPVRRLTADEQALVLLALTDRQVRDLVMCAIAVQGAERDVFDVLIPLVRSAPAGWVAPVATLAAVCAYLAGDGAATWVALDRAVHDDPDYRLAAMLCDGLSRAVPPAALNEMITSLPPIESWDGGDLLAWREQSTASGW
jgi:hypothetical protein